MNEKITLSINKLLRFCLPPLIKYTSSEFSAKTIKKHEHGGVVHIQVEVRIAVDVYKTLTSNAGYAKVRKLQSKELFDKRVKG